MSLLIQSAGDKHSGSKITRGKHFVTVDFFKKVEGRIQKEKYSIMYTDTGITVYEGGFQSGKVIWHS